MVEHVLIRLADLREEAAMEEWVQQHPRRAALAKLAKWARIKCMLVYKCAKDSRAARRATNSCNRTRANVFFWFLSLVLLTSRWLGVRPPRALAHELSTKSLLAEIKLRGLDSETCLNRCDLLDALCGEPPVRQQSSLAGKV
uniref:Uncharacterized protein n=1 Tax=Coccolithus braarudii TaxID=221442 RepID=A0A7S0LLZ7_9EUKA|mmetsp:Transcript_45629/g.97199  ORF Transcript_45629/g.97199 Transcript_45629/m.97199 type:complete len:142 (+) Transcript_45629:78-503(+)